MSDDRFEPTTDGYGENRTPKCKTPEYEEDGSICTHHILIRDTIIHCATHTWEELDDDPGKFTIISMWDDSDGFIELYPKVWAACRTKAMDYWEDRLVPAPTDEEVERAGKAVLKLLESMK